MPDSKEKRKEFITCTPYTPPEDPTREFMELVREKEFNLSELLYCFGDMAHPRDFAESLYLCYVQLTDYLLQDNSYYAESGLYDHLYRFRKLYEAVWSMEKITP